VSRAACETVREGGARRPIVRMADVDPLHEPLPVTGDEEDGEVRHHGTAVAGEVEDIETIGMCIGLRRAAARRGDRGEARVTTAEAEAAAGRRHQDVEITAPLEAVVGGGVRAIPAMAVAVAVQAEIGAGGGGEC